MWYCRITESDADIALASDKIISLQSLHSTLQEHVLTLQDEQEQQRHDRERLSKVSSVVFSSDRHFKCHSAAYLVLALRGHGLGYRLG